jgi:tRNA pseudouridine38-40 synthase
MQGRKPGNQARKQVESRRNIRLVLAFDGSPYHGWQIQPNHPTVQGIVAEAIGKITGERVTLHGSGRTDAGTHARGLVANFETASAIPPGQMVRAFNSMLPRDIRVLSARRVALDFHARRSAKSKIYRYQTYCGPVMPPHLAREHYHFPYPVEVPRMQRAARLFVGEHDFTSFTKKTALADDESVPKNMVRRIYGCALQKKGRRLLLTVEGNGFLRYMVRNMMGTLLEVGRGRFELERFRALFERRDRTLAGFTAPAQGLILVKVRY